MVATALDYDHPRYRTDLDDRYSGVLQIQTDISSGTATLLYDGRTILTAAHVVQNASFAELWFDAPDGSRKSLNTSSINILPDYDGVLDGDIALIHLEEAAPEWLQRYELYREFTEIDQRFDLVGFGAPATGTSGIESYYGSGDKLAASNRFDIEASFLDALTPGQMNWNHTPGSQLVADFDNSSYALDSIGRLTGFFDDGEGANEGFLSPGDSGGPALIDDMVAGVGSYIARFFDGFTALDINNRLDSSFGELGFWQRVSFYQQWIDEEIRASLPDPPEHTDDVKHKVSEGDAGAINYAYFFLEFSSVVENQTAVSVAYQTRDGSATAGEDYIAISGRANIYEGDDHTVIPVEIVGDDQPESNETFWLDVFDPDGGNFVNNLSVMSAQRTIMDDDTIIA